MQFTKTDRYQGMVRNQAYWELYKAAFSGDMAHIGPVWSAEELVKHVDGHFKYLVDIGLIVDGLDG